VSIPHRLFELAKATEQQIGACIIQN